MHLSKVWRSESSPIHVLGSEVGDVPAAGIRDASRVRKNLSFGIRLRGDNHTMFGCGDRALFLNWTGGPRKPIHVQTEVVKFWKVNVGRDGSPLQRPQKMLRVRLNEDKRADWVESLVFNRGLPSLPRGVVLRLDEFLHDMLPRAFGHQRVTRHQVRTSDLQIDGRLLVRFVFGVKDSVCSARVARFKALLLS